MDTARGAALCLLALSGCRTNLASPGDPDEAAAPRPTMTTTDFDSRWDYSNPAATEAAFRELVPTAAEAGLDEELQLWTQIARTKSLRGEIDEAHSILDEVEPRLGETTATAHVRYLLERGRTHRSGGDPEKARPMFEDAFARAEALGFEGYAGDALHMVALTFQGDEAVAAGQRGIEYCEKSDDPAARRWLGPFYHNLWMEYLGREDYESALAYAERSRDFRASTNDVDGERIGRWCIFHTYRKLGRLQEALDGQTALFAEYENGDPSGFCQEEIAECLYGLGREDEATPYFADAYAILKDTRWVVESDPDRVARLKQLGGL